MKGYQPVRPHFKTNTPMPSVKPPRNPSGIKILEPPEPPEPPPIRNICEDRPMLKSEFYSIISINVAFFSGLFIGIILAKF